MNYALEGSVAMAGSSVEWMRENLRMVNSGPELAGLAGKVPDNGGMYFVPAFSGLLAPYWRDDARGVFVGLTHFCTREHFCRAVLESVAFQSMEVFEAMQSDSGLQLQGLRVDGGLANSDLLLQFQADLLEITIGQLSPLDSVEIHTPRDAFRFLIFLSFSSRQSVQEVSRRLHWGARSLQDSQSVHLSFISMLNPIAVLSVEGLIRCGRRFPTLLFLLLLPAGWFLGEPGGRSDIHLRTAGDPQIPLFHGSRKVPMDPQFDVSTIIR